MNTIMDVFLLITVAIAIIGISVSYVIYRMVFCEKEEGK